ncbi:hypothetical protein FPZ43_09505 [Mucilaginibacter pallidiroseus]|uniref:LTXXQ motif family protein n=1 Tax=Mucilaginibacter pallidiroseus TaxID=2599295 RepID=A0A563UCZ4_9SPHI|nr:hypothetical protein [Mucilaginibacter pallidiroseus]TWR29200.1 hypothetical protein FPZ43_09505 [Mucilaginibacter pallidiroseus]
MKKLMLMILFVAGIGVMANAQAKTKKTPEQKAQHYTKVLTKKLTLTADQQAKVNTILLKRATQIDSLKANKTTADRKQKMAARKTIMEGADKDLKAVLNATQQKTYDDMKAKMIEKMKERRQAKKAAAGK